MWQRTKYAPDSFLLCTQVRICVVHPNPPDLAKFVCVRLYPQRAKFGAQFGAESLGMSSTSIMAPSVRSACLLMRWRWWWTRMARRHIAGTEPAGHTSSNRPCVPLFLLGCVRLIRMTGLNSDDIRKFISKIFKNTNCFWFFKKSNKTKTTEENEIFQLDIFVWDSYNLSTDAFISAIRPLQIFFRNYVVLPFQSRPEKIRGQIFFFGKFKKY